MRSIPKTALLSAVTIATLIDLGGGITPALAFCCFLLLILFPCAALATHFSRTQNSSPGFRIILGAVFAFICLTPLYYLRRAIPLPPTITDIAIALCLSIAAWQSGALRRFSADLRSPSLSPLATCLFLWLPLLFAATWCGYGATGDGEVRYHGLFPVDFCNLAGVVALINASPGLPLAPIAGTGPLAYHWFYFTAPAWLTHFMGFSLPAANSLVLFNYAAACLLFLAIHETASRFLKGPHAARIAVITAAIVIFCPLINHLHLLLAGASKLAWIAPGTRNFLLLPLTNSMTAFGNNTLALVMVLLLLLLMEEWNRTRAFRTLLCGALLLPLLSTYSVTLLPPAAACFALTILLPGTKHPALAATTGIAAGIIVLIIVKLLHIFGDSRGGFAPGFDDGAFLRTCLFEMFPLWAIAALGLRGSHGCRNYWLLLAACLAVPTFLYLKDSPTSATDLSMKIGSLMIVACTPMVAIGIETLAAAWRRYLAWTACILALLATGLAHTLIYAAQYPWYRLHGHADHDQRALVISTDYARALDAIRTSTSPTAIILDAEAPSSPACTTLFLGERRVWLPFTYTTTSAEDTRLLALPGMSARIQDWNTWRTGNFADPALSAGIARSVDYLLIRNHYLPPQDWERIGDFNTLSLFRSRAEPSKRD